MTTRLTESMRAVKPTRHLTQPGNWDAFCHYKTHALARETSPYQPGDVVEIDGRKALILEVDIYEASDGFLTCRYRARMWAKLTWAVRWQYIYPGFIDEGLTALSKKIDLQCDRAAKFAAQKSRLSKGAIHRLIGQTDWRTVRALAEREFYGEYRGYFPVFAAAVPREAALANVFDALAVIVNDPRRAQRRGDLVSL